MQFSLSRKKAAPAQQENLPNVDQHGSSSLENKQSSSGGNSEKPEAQLSRHEQSDSISSISNGEQNIHDENLKRIRDMGGQEVMNCTYSSNFQFSTTLLPDPAFGSWYNIDGRVGQSLYKCLESWGMS